MRISNWSSDVCSSDLAGKEVALDVDGRAARQGDATVRLRAAGADEAVRVRIDRSRRRALEHGIDDFMRTGATDRHRRAVVGDRVRPGRLIEQLDAVERDPRGGEIGRASCRERVCQYV